MTFAVIAYNQERFIREAARGALAQTYSPLEVVLSDDTSSDRTFELLKEVAAGYTGEHRVVLNRTERNLGIGGHVNQVMRCSTGEFVVVAAGDDWSVPERTARLVERWQEIGGGLAAVLSGFRLVRTDGREPPRCVLPSFVRQSAGTARAARVVEFVRSRPWLSGCTNSWSRSLFERFGPLPADLVFEDAAIHFRALLAGTLADVQAPLVEKRSHATNIFGSVNRPSSLWHRVSGIVDRSQRLAGWALRLVDAHQSDAHILRDAGELDAADADLIIDALGHRRMQEQALLDATRPGLAARQKAAVAFRLRVPARLRMALLLHALLSSRSAGRRASV